MSIMWYKLCNFWNGYKQLQLVFEVSEQLQAVFEVTDFQNMVAQV
jgi:hypothetical protein